MRKIAGSWHVCRIAEIGLRTHQPATRTAAASRAELKRVERGPVGAGPMHPNRLMAAHPAEVPMHQFANLSHQRSGVSAAPPLLNRTGLPGRLKAGIEHLSDLAMDDVRVHYNSTKPASVQALAYTKGTEIHLGPGQEERMPHEAWHVVQQKQGRVKPTLQMKGVTINDDAKLENEADRIGGMVLGPLKILPTAERFHSLSQPNNWRRAAPIQRQVEIDGKPLQNGSDFSNWNDLTQLQQNALDAMVSDSQLFPFANDRELVNRLQLVGPTAQINQNLIGYQISQSAVPNMIAPLSHGEASHLTSRTGKSGVEEGEVASYKVVQYLERTGDQLTGDHQPSGAAVKEALREALHWAKLGPLTRSQAANAYKRAITVVVQETWHLQKSRTFGGKNTANQIKTDADNLYQAALEDFKSLMQYWQAQGWTQGQILEVWNELDNARQQFFATGEMQAGSMAS